MPTYEYACRKCEYEFEREQRITEDPVKTCPKCKSRKVERLISATSFVLKGSGWYSDLYASSKPEKDKSAGDASEGKGEKKGDAATGDKAKSDEKSAEKKKPAKAATKGKKASG